MKNILTLSFLCAFVVSAYGMEDARVAYEVQEKEQLKQLQQAYQTHRRLGSGNFYVTLKRPEAQEALKQMGLRIRQIWDSSSKYISRMGSAEDGLSGKEEVKDN